MCGAYFLEDGKPLSHYHITDGKIPLFKENFASNCYQDVNELPAGSSIHPLYERYGDTIDASARMLVDPDWYW